MGAVHVRLREWRADDAPVVLRAFRAPDLRTQASWPVVTLKDASGWIAAWRGVGHAFAVTIEGPEGEQVVGNVAVSRLDDHDSGWVSYWVVPEARGRGIAAAATGELARWAFGELGLCRLELEHHVDNPASCRVATKAGFRPEGVERGERQEVERHVRLATDPPIAAFPAP